MSHRYESVDTNDCKKYSHKSNSTNYKNYSLENDSQQCFKFIPIKFKGYSGTCFPSDKVSDPQNGDIFFQTSCCDFFEFVAGLWVAFVPDEFPFYFYSINKCQFYFIKNKESCKKVAADKRKIVDCETNQTYEYFSDKYGGRWKPSCFL